jgi:hypothetical protein
MTTKTADETAEAEVLSVPTTITVSRTVKISGGEEAESSDVSEVIEVHKFATTPAMARVLIPIKKAHNYNSAGLTVGVDLPCYKEELPEALERAYNLAKERLLAELPKILDALKKI